MFHGLFRSSTRLAGSARAGRSSFAGVATAVLLSILRSSPAVAADAAPGNPISKVYVGEVHGDDAFIQIGDRSQPLTAKETYRAEGATFESKAGTTMGLVFSNGLAVEVHADTRLEVRRFAQEPFRPNRTDVASEPSISDIELVLTHGTVVISTSTLAPGSRLELRTLQAAFTIQGGTLVVTADAASSVASVVAGGCTVHDRADSTHVEIVKAGEMATAHLGVTGDATHRVEIDVSRIPAGQLATLTDQATPALQLKRTVYFEAKQVGAAFTGATGLDGPGANGVTPRPAFELNPVPLMSGQLPLQYVVSPAALVR